MRGVRKQLMPWRSEAQAREESSADTLLKLYVAIDEGLMRFDDQNR
jgi:hypothetical protein